MNSNFPELLSARSRETDDIVKSFLPAEEGNLRLIFEALNYSVKAGGKRLRPLIMRECFRAFSDDQADERILWPFMAAMEYIHTYSLVHDDLPAMDNDLLRRGLPTTHAKYGEDIGILAGDALLNYAFETIGHLSDETLSLSESRRVLKAVKILADRSGSYGMIGGQVLDLKGCEELSELDFLEKMYSLKTGCLLQAAFVCGAVLAGAEEAVLKSLDEAARLLGVAFQIKDDILDETSTAEELGKPIFSDRENGKRTYASIVGIEAAQEKVVEYSERCKTILRSLAANVDFLCDLVDYLTIRRK